MRSYPPPAVPGRRLRPKPELSFCRICSMRLQVVSHKEATTAAGKTLYAIRLQDLATDHDAITLQSGWPGVLAQFPVGTQVLVDMFLERPTGQRPPSKKPSPAAQRWRDVHPPT